ncbi:MAG: tetratricopeptide repeat protein [Desulfovermiculus sp.]
MSESRHDQAHEQPTAQETPPPVAGWAKVITDNLKTIGLILGAIIVAAALFSGYSYYKTRTLRNAQQSVDRIMSQKEGQARISALEDFLAQAPEEMTTGLHLQVARLGMQEGEYARAASHWEKAQEGIQDQDLRIVAVLGRAAALAEQGDSSKALELLQETASQAPQRYQRSLKSKIASIAENTQQWELALQAYQDIAGQAELNSQRDEYIEHKINVLENKLKKSQSS